MQNTVLGGKRNRGAERPSSYRNGEGAKITPKGGGLRFEGRDQSQPQGGRSALTGPKALIPDNLVLVGAL